MSRTRPISNEPPATRLRITTLGAFKVEVEGESVHLQTKADRPLTLLKVLVALGGEAVAIEQLVESLWPDSDGDRANGAFRTTLNRLRQLIGQSSLIVRAGRLSLAPGQCRADAIEYAALLKQAARNLRSGEETQAAISLDAALGLYNGPFLAGEFEPAEILTARSQFHASFLRHVEDFANHYLQAKRFDEVIVLCRRALEIDPQAEFLYRCLMRAYLEQGQIASGKAAYERCRDVLRTTVGVVPSEETNSLFRTFWEILPEQIAYGLPAAAVKLPNPIQPADRGSIGIAVLPFKNLSGDPEQEYFANGLTEDLITDLAALPLLKVIARKTMFNYKRRRAQAHALSQELGVSFIVEGSVRKSGAHLRMTAQLINSADGSHVWAGRFDREMADIFAIQDEIVWAVITELHVKLIEGEQARSWRRSTTNAQAYDAFMRAIHVHRQHQHAREVDKAIQHCEEAVSLDPNFAHAHAYLAYLRWIMIGMRFDTDIEENWGKALGGAKRALGLDHTLPLPYAVRGFHELTCGDPGAGEALLQRAAELNPDAADVMALVAVTQSRVGKHQIALETLSRAIGLSPHHSPFMDAHRGLILFHLQRYEEAILALNIAKDKRGTPLLAGFYLAASLAAAGRKGECQEAAASFIKIYPDFQLREWFRRRPIIRQEDRDLMERWARAAGLPE